MRSILTAAALAIGLGLALPAAAQTTPKDAGRDSPQAKVDAGQSSPLAKKDAGQDPPLAKRASETSPLAKPEQPEPLTQPATSTGQSTK
jgi:hypothetical protein